MSGKDRDKDQDEEPEENRRKINSAHVNIRHSFLLVNFCLSSEFLGESSSSDHLSPSSPTAKIVSPSSEWRGGWLSLTGFGGSGEREPLPLGIGERASSSSSREPPKEAISKPSSS